MADNRKIVDASVQLQCGSIIIKDIPARVAQITKKSDPFDEEIEKCKQKAKEAETRTYSAQHSLKILKPCKCPDELDKNCVSNIVSWLLGGVITYAVVLAILFAFHILYWFVRWIWSDPWQTWEWVKFFFNKGWWLGIAVFVIGAIVSIIQAATYEKRLAKFKQYDSEKSRLENEVSIGKKEISKLEKKEADYVKCRHVVLERALRDLAVPIPAEMIKNKNYSGIKNSYLEFQALALAAKEETIKEKADDLKRQLADKKLKFVYEVSMKAEAGSDDTYREFGDCCNKALKANDLMPLRRELPSSKGAKAVNEIVPLATKLQKDGLEGLLNKFQKAREEDTKSFIFFTDTRKLSGQTKEMMNIVNRAQQEYSWMQDAGETVMRALNYSRMCAYRNLYLGVELLNYVRSGAGGGKLTTAKSSFDVSDIEIACNDSFDAKDFKADLGVTLDNTLDFLETIDNNKFLRKASEANPALALGATAFVAVSSFINERNAKINQNIDAQKTLIENMEAMAEGYTQGRAQMLRAAEIIKSIVKANDGFMTIYAPLGKRVFEENTAVLSMQEVQELSKAIKAYKEISMTEL